MPVIITTYDPPPIPFRGCDWSAIDDRTYDGPGSPIGYGRTEDEAIADLLSQLDPDDDDGVRLRPGQRWATTSEHLDD
jgi:hypothetical protein